METPIESSKVVIEVLRTETIKPLTPTPDHLKMFGMSITDHRNANIHMPIVLFYPAGSEMSVADRNRRLKESLSKTLVRFYPLAGRVDQEGAYVDCDDSGVEFVETKVNGCSLADILEIPDNEVLRKLLPCDMITCGPDTLLRVKSNVFECGGMAVAMSLSHVITDGSGRGTFLKEWTATARGDVELSPMPELNAIASRFPAVPNAPFSDAQIFPMGIVLRRFVFNSVKITSLRDRAISASGVRPSRVEAVTAFIYKCMVNSLTAQLGHETRPSVAHQFVNLRSKLNPPIPLTSLGSMITIVSAESGDRNELANDATSIIAQFKEGIRDMTRNFETRLTDLREILKTPVKMKTITVEDDKDMYSFSSICGFDHYGLDFGWGKPVWISIADLYRKNQVLMLDARERGGIETWINLTNEHMAFLETNTEFLEFASLNPTINLS